MKGLIKTTIISAAIFFVVLFLVSCRKNFDAATVAGLTSAIIKGTVVNSQTNQPVGGATITVDGKSAGTTASDGTFVISGLGTGTHTIVATLSGNTGSTNVLIVEDDIGTAKEVTVKIEQTGTTATKRIVGRVTDAVTLKGIDGVNVKITEQDISTTTTNYDSVLAAYPGLSSYIVRPSSSEDMAGYFVLENLDTGDYHIEFSKAGYLKKTVKITIDEDVETYEAKLNYDTVSTGILAGTVYFLTNETLQTVATAEVILDTGQRTTTTGSGNYKLDNVPERIVDRSIGELGYTLTATKQINGTTYSRTVSLISVVASKTTLVDIILNTTLNAPDIYVPEQGSTVDIDKPLFNWSGVGAALYYKIVVWDLGTQNPVPLNGGGTLNLSATTSQSDLRGLTDEGQIVWQYDTTNSSTTKLRYNSDSTGVALSDEHYYLIGVKSADFSTVSDWGMSWFYKAAEGSAGGGTISTFSLVYPADGETIEVDAPEFNWTQAGGATAYKFTVWRYDGALDPIQFAAAYSANPNTFLTDAAQDSGTIVEMQDITSGSTTTYTYGGETLIPGRIYIWAVTPLNINSTGTTLYSWFQYGQTPLAMPQAVTPLTGEIVAVSTPIFSWTQSPKASSYNLEVWQYTGGAWGGFGLDNNSTSDDIKTVFTNNRSDFTLIWNYNTTGTSVTYNTDSRGGALGGYPYIWAVTPYDADSKGATGYCWFTHEP